MSAFFESPVDVFVYGETVSVLFGEEGIDKDNILVAVVS